MSKKLKKYVPIVAAAFMLNLAGVIDVYAFERLTTIASTPDTEYATGANLTRAILRVEGNKKILSGIKGTYDPNTKLTVLISIDGGYNYKEVDFKKEGHNEWSVDGEYTAEREWDENRVEVTKLVVQTYVEGEGEQHYNRQTYPIIKSIYYAKMAELTKVDTNYSIKGVGCKGSKIQITRLKTNEVVNIEMPGEYDETEEEWSHKFVEELTVGEKIEVATMVEEGHQEKYVYKITEDDLEKKDENKEDDKKEEGNSGENQGTDKEEGGNSGENQGTDKEEGENQDTNKEQEGNNVENQDSDKKDEENKEQNQGNNTNQSNNSGSGGSHSSSSGSHGGSGGSHSSSSSSKNETNSDENDLDENIKKEVNVISENEITDNNLQIGWQFDGINDWSYIKEDKTKAVNCWLKIDGNWYNFDNNGVMRKNYWLKDQEKWYYLSPSGAMPIGWLKYNDKWYYLDENGVMCTGWIQYNNNWYYLGQDGAMKTGWINVDNMWYYLDESGKMAVNTTINGYKINRHGIWVK